jgi:serine/threonine protein kinase
MTGMLSLSKYGWDGCTIPTVLSSELLDALPTWRNLKKLGEPEMRDGRSVYVPMEYFTDEQNRLFYPLLSIADKLDEGSYGTIYKAERALCCNEGQGPFVSIVSKQTPVVLSEDEQHLSEEEKEACYADEIQALLFEAALHVLAHKTMTEAGHPTVVPELFDVLALPWDPDDSSAANIKAVWIQMEYIRGENLHTYFKTHLRLTLDVAANDQLLVDILIQLCVYMDILQKSLYFNHRDLKLNNVLRRRTTPGWTKTLTHPALREPWICQNDLTIIDFGFSCVGCEDSVQSLIQAGSWFRQDHDCLKGGRDMALFLYCLHCCFPLRGRISKGLWGILEKAMVAEWDTERIHLLEVGVEKNGNPGHMARPHLEFDAGIYRFLRHTGIEVPGCEPRRLMATLEAFMSGRGTMAS